MWKCMELKAENQLEDQEDMVRDVEADMTEPCAICVYSSRPNNGGQITFLGKPGMRTRCMAGNAPHKSSRCRD